MNDSTALPPAHGSPPHDPPSTDPMHDAGPSLASSIDTDAERLLPFPAHPAPIGLPSPPDSLTPLEERLRRLEDALAQVAERPIPVAQIVPPAAPTSQEPSVTIPTGMILDVGRRLLSSTAALSQPRHATPERHTESGLMHGVRRTFLFFDLLAEARAIWHMFTDPRYKMSWAGRLVPLALAVFLLTSVWLVPGAQIPFFGTFIDKVADFIPAFILFKWLSYEARRYRETAPDLPADLRL